MRRRGIQILFGAWFSVTYLCRRTIIRGSIQKFPKYINETIRSYLDLILHYLLQSSPLWSAHTDPSVYVTFEMHPGSNLNAKCFILVGQTKTSTLLEFLDRIPPE
jgi:hypothetical protein